MECPSGKGGGGQDVALEISLYLHGLMMWSVYHCFVGCLSPFDFCLKSNACQLTVTMIITVIRHQTSLPLCPSLITLVLYSSPGVTNNLPPTFTLCNIVTVTPYTLLNCCFVTLPPTKHSLLFSSSCHWSSLHSFFAREFYPGAHYLLLLYELEPGKYKRKNLDSVSTSGALFMELLSCCWLWFLLLSGIVEIAFCDQDGAHSLVFYSSLPPPPGKPPRTLFVALYILSFYNNYEKKCQMFCKKTDGALTTKFR